jgi:flagellar hook-associated protein 1 FlgK
MALSLALDAALSGLSATAEQTALVSRNVARAGEAGASRKIAGLVTMPGSGVRVASITRASNAALLDKLLETTADAGAQRSILEALDQLEATVNDPELDASPAALVGRLADAIQVYAAAPQNAVAARSAVAAASDLAQGLNDATRVVQGVRTQADADMADAVDQLNTLLARFAAVNTEIVKASRSGADITDHLDQRDQLLASIAEQVGIKTISRADNDMAIFTDSGVTLFDVGARSVSFDRTLLFTPGVTGNAVYVDGVPITGNTGPMRSGTGRLTGLAAVRDTLAVTYQGQLDEVARGLIEVFAESDQSAVPALPDRPGLFTYPGAPAMPASGSLLVGLAGSIAVNASVDPGQGGDATLLRDGGICGNPAYVYNATGAAGYSARLEQFLDRLNAPRAFDPAVQGITSATVAGFGASSVAWLQEARRTASDNNDYKSALLQRTSDALSRETGVNLDEEMERMLELERAYQASSKLISAIDAMLAALLEAAGR